ncbi:MAG: COG4705 family protein [Chthoniobacterales bacterium]
MDERKSDLVAKVPQVTLLFWIIKILATTLGETGGDAVTMSWLGETTTEAKGTGYLIGTAIFGVVFVAAVLVQIRAKKFHPFLYWLTIVATTTVGTTLADYCTRSLVIGYTGGSTILLIFVIASLLIWRWSTGSISIETVNTPKVEVFYWVTIMFSQTLGTALGDWVADTNEMGYVGAAAVFGGLLLLTALLYYFTSLSRAVLFWAAFILTRPLGAVVGDFLDKPHAQGGLALSRYTASLALLVVIIALLLIFPQKPASKAH